jgi:hypothetical protein
MLKNSTTGLLERQNTMPIETHGAMHVEVLQCIQGWSLIIESSSCQVFRVFTAPRLIEVLELASTLQLRIDNQLPLEQYYKVG